MYIDPKRCIQCGTRVRPNLNPDDITLYNVQCDGTFSDSPYWFCSVDCYQKLVGRFLKDPQFQFECKPDDDMGFIEHHLKICYENPVNPILEFLGLDKNIKYQEQKDHEYRVEWYKQKRAAIEVAEHEVLKQLVAEHIHQAEIDTAKQMELEAKEEIRRQKERERLEEKQQREEERARREQERLDDKRAREEEKRRKEEAERAAREWLIPLTQVALDVVCREVGRVRSPGRTPDG
jgi:hypothetical protein